MSNDIGSQGDDRAQARKSHGAIWALVFGVLAVVCVVIGFAETGSGIYKDDGYPFFVAAAVLLVGAGLTHTLGSRRGGPP